MAIIRVLPPISGFSKENSHGIKKQALLDQLTACFERYYGLVG